MADLVWTRQANEHYAEIIDYIERDSPSNAVMVANELMSIAESIRIQPLTGAMVPEYEIANLRERLACGYRMIYRTRPTLIEILAIYRASRPLPEKPPR